MSRKRTKKTRAVENHRAVGLAQALQSLPLFTDTYLNMQAINLDLIDQFIEDQETRLLHEYFEKERTPLPSTMFVSALCQLWIFGLYELLRTWRQRGKDLLRWSKELHALPEGDRPARLLAKRREIEKRAADPEGAEVFHWPVYEAAADPAFGETLRKALDRSERLFRRIEAFRVTLAKHEMPGVPGSFAMAPGYGRIDMTDGSIYWQVVLRGNEVDIVSRRTLADECKRLALDRRPAIIPERVQDQMKRYPDDSYGIKRIAVTVDDGIEHPGVYVAWCKEIVGIDGMDDALPFDPDRIASIRPDPRDKHDADI
ncbi:MAG: hypothetical protein DMD92_05890 [Candidatus Rokuibacteriota bacterium]|nr:MAG: hypothetical protein DMD92_05890 [Candidatus Rokubacteria bacterium]